jgi:hypothetical protein
MARAMTRQLTAILSTEPVWSDGQPCHCFCGARHGEWMGVCEGRISGPAVLIHFNSIYDSTGVMVCRPCAEAMPDVDLVS